VETEFTTKEIIDELRDKGEEFIIEQCKKQIYDKLMVGPYEPTNSLMDDDVPEPARRAKDQPLIPDRQRINVMSVVLDKIDVKNIVVTVAVVDHFGKLIDNKDFTHMWFKKKN
jgi:transcriptional accessory protein Tex/SPT6